MTNISVDYFIHIYCSEQRNSFKFDSIENVLIISNRRKTGNSLFWRKYCPRELKILIIFSYMHLFSCNAHKRMYIYFLMCLDSDDRVSLNMHAVTVLSLILNQHTKKKKSLCIL
jgi:hypothetical protein